MLDRPPQEEGKPHFGYIDCVRGIAVIMVITSHFAQRIPQLPYPVHRLMVPGWYGVQLFFLASCVTLLMSWHHEAARHGSADVGGFFIRRYFRIAPGYYLAAILYFFLEPPSGGFDPVQALTSALFLNAWHPVWMTTVHGAWQVVPGGWSIGVEFSFYACFPIFASWVTSLRRAWLAFAVALAVGIVANRLDLAVLSGSYARDEIRNFLFFWFPNECSVFALGAVLFFILRQGHGAAWLRRHATVLSLSSLVVFGMMTYLPLGAFLGAWPPIPVHLAVCVPMIGLVMALSTGRGWLVNRPLALMGKVSFSGYLFQFAVLDLIGTVSGSLLLDATGYRAIVIFVLGWPVAVGLTFACSWVTYHVVELPMIDLGKSLIRARRAKARAAA